MARGGAAGLVIEAFGCSRNLLVISCTCGRASARPFFWGLFGGLSHRWGSMFRLWGMSQITSDDNALARGQSSNTLALALGSTFVEAV